MLVNNENLDTIRTTATARFQEGLAKPDRNVEEIATPVDGQGKAITQVHLENLVGNVREWVGERHIANMINYMQSVTHKKWEQTYRLSREDIERDNLGLFGVGMEQLGRSAASEPWYTAITRVFSDGFTVAGIDAVSFFNASHTWPGAYTTAQDNLTDALFDADELDTALVFFDGVKGPDGRSLRTHPTHFIGGSATREAAETVFLSPVNASGASNPHYKRIPKENIIIDGDIDALQANSAWCLLDCSKLVKPLAFVREQWPPEITTLMDTTNEHVFKMDEYLFGARMKYELAAVCWWLAYGSDGSGS